MDPLVDFGAEASTPQSATQSVLNTVGNPNGFRLQAALDWQLRGDGVAGPGMRIVAHDIAGYRNPESAAVPHVRSATTVDLQVFEPLSSQREKPEFHVTVDL